MEIDSEVVSDFVIRRKRKRTPAVDPCLGFYLQSPPSPPKHLVALQSVTFGRGQISKSPFQDNVASSPLADNSRSLLEPSLQTVTPIYPDTEEDLTVVTVEDFLRISTKKPTKVYKGRMKHRVVNLENPQQADTRDQLGETEASRNERGHRIGTTHQPHNGSESLTAVDSNERHRRRRKPLADRILRAAILSHVEADHILGFDEPSVSFRRPLPFIKENGSPKPPRLTRTRRTLTFVDPRKISPFRQAVFSSHRRVDMESMVHKSCTKRRVQASECRFTRTKGRGQKKELPLCVSICPPLSFVPLRDAERISTYERHIGSGEDTAKILENQHVGRRGLALQLPMSKLEPQSISKSSAFGSSSAFKFSSSIFSSPMAVPATDDHSQPPKDIPTTHPHRSVCNILHRSGQINSGHSNTDIYLNHNAQISLQNSQTDGMEINKSLKTLTSFLDGFLRTARDTTQMQTPTISKPQKNKSTDSDRRERNPRRVRTSNRQREARSFKPKISPNPTNYILPRNSDPVTLSATSNAGAPSSTPDILTALQPQFFQVVLSSSPPDFRSQPEACHNLNLGPGFAESNGNERMSLDPSVDLFAGFGCGP